ncbi:hypothetical protein Y032_0258g433 [Ancylostoma ceylanicum]|uniref:Peptidase A1 domain-containing protein n=1 Tax=Ancylostoma ceylanicum TaxID=53326 RepID=A0A016SBC9_9BILA|nr:hypothetical protein Y032_0258g433 [Ancylostoma ceylanicum]
MEISGKRSPRWLYLLYGNATVEGFYGNDTMRFGNVGTSQLIVPGTIFGQAVKLHEHFVGRHIDGILGLAFSSMAEGRGEPPFERAVKLGRVKPIFTIYMKHVGRESGVYGGEITYGGLDGQHCDGSIVYHSLSLATYWQFKVKDFTETRIRQEKKLLVTKMRMIEVNSLFFVSVILSMYLMLKITTFTSGNFSAASILWVAMSDTVSSVIGAPVAIAEAVAKQFNADYNAEDDKYYINCNAKPVFVFGIGNEKYTVGSTNLVIQIRENECILALSGYGAPYWGPNWIFGVPFIREYCNIYDVANKRIGFAMSLRN